MHKNIMMDIIEGGDIGDFIILLSKNNEFLQIRKVSYRKRNK